MCLLVPTEVLNKCPKSSLPILVLAPQKTALFWQTAKRQTNVSTPKHSYTNVILVFPRRSILKTDLQPKSQIYRK